jgi:hypothetical protein
MDTRLRSTELRQIKTGAGQAIEASAVSVTDNTIGVVVSDNAPSDWIRVSGGKYYSKRVTGETDRVELYLESDTGAYTDNTLRVSGINSPYDVSGDFVVTAVTPSGAERPSWMDALPVGVTSSIVYTTGQDIPESVSLDLATRYQILSYSATVTEATIVFTAPHTFEVGDIVDVSDLESPFDGIDGIHRVSSKTSDSINYVFTAEIGAPVASTTPGTTSYVYSVAQKRALAGDTWIDTSTTPTSTTYYWDGLRWSLSRSAATEGTQDTLAPADVTNIQSTSSAYTIDGGIARARVNLTWEAPTKNSDDTDLTDLAGYEVWANYAGPTGPWTEKTGILSASTSATISNLNQNVPVYFKVFAVDSSLNRSTGADYNTTTSIYALELNPPSLPLVSTRNGVVTVIWNGLDNTGVNPPPTIRTLEVHAGGSAGFTPSTSTLKGTMSAGSGNYFHIVDLTYDTDWYIKLVAVDVNNNKTAGSIARFTTVSRVDAPDLEAGSIRANKVEAGFLSGLLVEGETLRATSGTDPNALVEFTSNYFRAVNSSNQETFRIDVANGVTTIGASTVISGNNISTGTINAANVAVTNLNANNITSGTINANVISVTNLNASNITFGTLNGNNVTVQNLSASSITSGSFSGDRITAGTLTADRLDATTRIRLGDSNTSNPSNYVEMGYVTLPATGASAPGFLGQYNGYKSFYMGGWNDGYNSNGMSIGVISTSGTIADVLTVSGYDNGFGYASGVSLDAGLVSIRSFGGNYSDSQFGDISLNAGDSNYGSIVLTPSNQIDAQGKVCGVLVKGVLRIDTGGDITPSSTGHAFQIGATDGVNLRIDNNEIAGYTNGSATGIYIQQDGGDVRLGNVARGMGVDNDKPYANGVYGTTLTTSYRSVYVSSTLTYNQLGYVASSRRFKKNIEPLGYTAEQILQLEPVQYHYNEEEDIAPKHAGFIAEQMHDLGLSGYVSYGEDGLPETIQYEFFVSALQTVVRHQATQISDLEARLAALESRINSN